MSSNDGWAAGGEIAVVHSYHETFVWVREVNKGIDNYIQGKRMFGIEPISSVKDYRIQYYYMNAKQHVQDETYLRSVAGRIAESLIKQRPEVVIVCDEEALKYVAAPLKEDVRLKFVFLGVMNDPRKFGVVDNYERPEYNITGLISEHPFEYSIKMVTKIFPDRDNIYVYFDDSLSGHGIYEIFKRHLNTFSTDIKRRFKSIVISNDWHRWKVMIGLHQNKRDLNLFGTFYSLNDENGEPISDDTVIKWIRKHSKIPEITILSSHVRDGMLMSISNPGYVHGYEATHMAAQVTAGKRITDMPIGVPSQKAVHVNMERAEEIAAVIPVDIIALSNYFNKLDY